MAAFNVVQRRRRAAIADNKRAKHGDPVTGKLKQRSQTIPISGKRKRKLFKKWRRDQKDAIAKGLVTMEDVEMAVAEGTSENVNKAPLAFNVKKILKVKPKRSQKKEEKDERWVSAEIERLQNNAIFFQSHPLSLNQIKWKKAKSKKPAQEAAVDAMEFV